MVTLLVPYRHMWTTNYITIHIDVISSKRTIAISSESIIMHSTMQSYDESHLAVYKWKCFVQQYEYGGIYIYRYSVVCDRLFHILFCTVWKSIFLSPSISLAFNYDYHAYIYIQTCACNSVSILPHYHCQ